MDYTKNHHLPQWELTDRVLMEDFNQMCLDMEAGLDKTAQDAANAVAQAESKAAAAVAQAASTAAAATAKAQSTANTAVSKADAAQAAANAAQASADAAYRPGVLPYVTGTYTGTGEFDVERHVTLGFAPRFVMVTAMVSGAVNVHVMGAAGITLHPIVPTDNGFFALAYYGWPQVNEKDIKYFYIAFP